MASIIPKFKLYALISIFQMLINIVAYMFMEGGLFSLNGAIVGTAGVIGGFIPFASIVSLAFLQLPDIVTGIIAIFTVMFGIIQAFLIVVMIANVVPTENV